MPNDAFKGKDNRKSKRDLEEEIKAKADKVARRGADRLVELAVDNINHGISGEQYPDHGQISNTGNLAASWNIDKRDEGHYVVTFDADYATYVEFGTEPHWPPPGPIKEWVNLKINPPDEELDDVTFLVQRKIAEEGTPAQPYLRPAKKQVEREKEDLANDVL